MKKNLFWSFLAASAVMTSCSNETLLDSQTPVLTGEEVPVSFTINMGNEMSTYATESRNGGWSNYKVDTDMQNAYNHRAIIQVFAQSGDLAKPIAEVRKVINTTPNSDKIELENLRLPAGHSYTAVVWVDFVADATTESTTAVPNDLYYDTKNLREVKMLGVDESGKMYLPNTPEGRDAYTNRVNFTVAENGSFATDEPSKGSEVSIPITARRAFGKVRVVLTDWDNKAQWDMYANGQLKVMDQIEMTVYNLATTFNALTGVPTTPTNNPAVTFVRDWTAWGADTEAGVANNVNWITKDGKKYPILDFNYFIPYSNDDASSYKMDIKTFDKNFVADPTIGTENKELISARSFSSIPVKNNCLTTIWGNFLTAGYNFTVTVDDEFNQQSSTTVEDDGSTTDIVKNWGITTARVERDASGKVTKIVVDKNGNCVNFDLEAWNKVIYEIGKLSYDISDAEVFIHVCGMPTEASFGDLEVGNFYLRLESTSIANAVEMKDLKSPLTITNKIDQNFPITVNSGSDVTFNGKNTFNAGSVITVNAVNITFDGKNLGGDEVPRYRGTVTATATGNITFNHGQFDAVVTVNGALATGASTITTAAIINGGEYKNNISSDVNTTINGGTLPWVDAENAGAGNGVPDFMLTITNAKTLTINKTTHVFGPIYTPMNSGCNLVYNSLAIKALYNTCNIGNWASVTPSSI